LSMTIATLELWRAVIVDERDPHIQSESACLWLHEDWRSHRLQIYAAAPAGIQERSSKDPITCDPDRSREAIARDICSRLLSHARQHLKESIEYDRERKQKEAEKNLRLHFLRKYLPREYQSEKLCNSTSMRMANIFAHITYDNLINLEITISLKDALAILEFIQKRKPSQ